MAVTTKTSFHGLKTAVRRHPTSVLDFSFVHSSDGEDKTKPSLTENGLCRGILHKRHKKLYNKKIGRSLTSLPAASRYPPSHPPTGVTSSFHSYAETTTTRPPLALTMPRAPPIRASRLFGEGTVSIVLCISAASRPASPAGRNGATGERRSRQGGGGAVKVIKKGGRGGRRDL